MKRNRKIGGVKRKSRMRYLIAGILPVGILLLVSLPKLGGGQPPDAMFTDVASDALADVRGNSLGACWGDVDGDGDEDLFVADNNNSGRLWQNAGGRLVENGKWSAGLAGLPPHATGCAFIDIDNDGDLDLYVTGLNRSGKNALLRNDGAGGFVEVATTAGVGMSGFGSASADWADYDGDGDYDGFVAARWGRGRRNALYEQVGPTAFRDVATAKELADPAGPPRAFLGSWFDYDADGDVDLLLAIDFWGAELYRNDRGNFTRVTAAAFPPATDDTPGAPPNNAMGVTWGDFDNDGCVDVFITGMNVHGQGGFDERAFTDLASRLYRSNCDGTFSDVTKRSGFKPTGVIEWGANFIDFDNDGDLDLSVVAGNAGKDRSRRGVQRYAKPIITAVVSVLRRYVSYRFATWAYRYEAMIPASGTTGPAGAMPNFLYQNQLVEKGSATFADVTAALGATNFGPAWGSAWADVDGDGDLDWFIPNKGMRNHLFRNNGPVGNYLRVHLVGAPLKTAVGAWVKIKVGNVHQQRHVHVLDGYLSQSQMDPHFGLGVATTVDEVWVRWPNTTTWVSVCKQVPANRRITVTEGQGCRS